MTHVTATRSLVSRSRRWGTKSHCAGAWLNMRGVEPTRACPTFGTSSSALPKRRSESGIHKDSDAGGGIHWGSDKPWDTRGAICMYCIYICIQYTYIICIYIMYIYIYYVYIYILCIYIYIMYIYIYYVYIYILCIYIYYVYIYYVYIYIYYVYIYILCIYIYIYIYYVYIYIHIYIYIYIYYMWIYNICI